jgi:hypothetical protein
VKFFGSTGGPQKKLSCLREVEVQGISGGAVKCVDIGRNTNMAKALYWALPDAKRRKLKE